MTRHSCSIVALILTLFCGGCITDPGIDQQKARQFSDAFLEDVINDRQDAMYSKMEAEFRQIMPRDKFSEQIVALNDQFGKITSYKIEAHEIGARMLYNASTKPTAKIIYQATTTKGVYPLSVTVVPNGNDLAVTAFMFTVKSQ